MKKLNFDAKIKNVDHWLKSGIVINAIVFLVKFMKTVNNVKIGFAFIVIIKTLISRSYVNANNVENVKNASFKIC